MKFTSKKTVGGLLIALLVAPILATPAHALGKREKQSLKWGAIGAGAALLLGKSPWTGAAIGAGGSLLVQEAKEHHGRQSHWCYRHRCDDYCDDYGYQSSYSNDAYGYRGGDCDNRYYGGGQSSDLRQYMPTYSQPAAPRNDQGYADYYSSPQPPAPAYGQSYARSSSSASAYVGAPYPQPETYQPVQPAYSQGNNYYQPAPPAYYAPAAPPPVQRYYSDPATGRLIPAQ